MGTCKDEMKPTDEKAKRLFGRILSKKNNGNVPEKTAKTFCDELSDVEESLSKLIVVKETDLANEKGREDYNRKALARLQTMEFHLEQIIEQAAEYSKN